MTRCPMCGYDHNKTNHGVSFDAMRGLVFRGDGEAFVSGTEMKVLMALVMADNTELTNYNLVAATWPKHPPGDAYHTIKVHISRIRKSVKHLGIDVLPRRGLGYYLEFTV